MSTFSNLAELPKNEVIGHDEPLMNKTELCKHLGISYSYLIKLENLGLPLVAGKSKPSWVLAWIQKQAGVGTASSQSPA